MLKKITEINKNKLNIMLFNKADLEIKKLALYKMSENNNKLKCDKYKWICSINIASPIRLEFKNPVIPPPRPLSNSQG